MKAVALLLALATTASCTMTLGQRRAAGVGGAALLGVGIAATAIAHGDCNTDAFDESVGCAVHHVQLGAVGPVLAILGAVALVAAAASPSPAEPPKPLVEEPATAAVQPSPNELADLTEAARVAARAGSCRTVESIAERVAVLDPDYRANTFARDRDIAGCVD